MTRTAGDAKTRRSTETAAMTEAERRERQELAKSDQHVADAERLIARQEMLTERLRADGHDTIAAIELLATMKQTLNEHRVHRELILERIAHLAALEQD